MRHRRPLLALIALAFAVSPAVEADPPAPPRGRVWRRTQGFVRVPAERLRALGFASANEVAVTHRGRPVAVAAPSEDGDLVFLAIDAGGAHSAWAAYDLHARPGEAAPAPSATAGDGGPPPAPAPLPSLRVLREDRIHGPLAAAEPEVYDGERPTWFLARIPRGTGATLPLDPRGAAKGAPQRLEVQAFATHEGPIALRARWGDRDLGTAEAPSAAAGAAFVWDVPPEAVPEEAEPLALMDVSPPPPPPEEYDTTEDRGTVWVDQVALAGLVAPSLDESLRNYRVAAGNVVALVDDRTEDLLPDLLQGSEAHAVCVAPDLAPAARPVRLPGTGAVRLAIPAGVPEGTVLFVSRRAEEAEVVPVPPSADPVAAAEGAAHLVLAVPALLEPSRRLAAHRTAHGLRSAVVSVADVYETFAQGERDGDAIRDYLLALAAREGNPLRFVLLAGDATLDRTDLRAEETIPAPMARTKYNGATASDRLYATPEDPTDLLGGPSIGRVPFRRAEDMAAYVDRVIAYETRPPADDTRRRLRFITGEGRFGAIIDRLIEGRVEDILAKNVPAAYDLEMTYANPESPYFWPAEDFSRKVLDDLNAGSLFFTYVGHGFAQGFDRVEGHPILHVSDVDEVAVRGTPPIAFVFACTTAIFDHPGPDGVGEALLARPAGPLAYYGATRICHPAANAILGQELARRLFADGGARTLGETLDAARNEMLRPTASRMLEETVLRAFPTTRDLPRLYREASWLYVLLGDPALRPALPSGDLRVEARRGGKAVDVEVRGPAKAGAPVRVTLEVPRSRRAHDLIPLASVAPGDRAEAIRENHRRVNDKVLAAATVTPSEDGVARATLAVPEGFEGRDLVVKASTVAGGDVRQGAAPLAADRD